jgi:hypothetical protein
LPWEAFVEQTILSASLLSIPTLSDHPIEEIMETIKGTL